MEKFLFEKVLKQKNTGLSHFNIFCQNLLKKTMHILAQACINEAGLLLSIKQVLSYMLQQAPVFQN